MALQLGALRDALIDAGASTEKAKAASEELAAYDHRLAGIDTRLSVLTWMVGACIALSLIAVGGIVTLSSKLGEIGGTLAQLAHATH